MEKWVLEFDKTLSTTTWLKFEKSDRYHVALLKCIVFERFISRRNFNKTFIEGSANLRTLSSKSDMHERAIPLLRKEQSSDVCHYAPIARAFYRMDQQVEKSMKKFDIAYWIAKRGVAFSKMKSLCWLEERHGVELGECYKNDHASATFVAEDLCGQLSDVLKKVKLFLVVYFDPNSNDGAVHVRNRYLCV